MKVVVADVEGAGVDYHFAETRPGDILLVYCDRRRRRWFLQGQVC